MSRIGALGERLVETALIWHGWAPANLNQLLKTAPNVDLLAMKGTTKISIQVKASGPNSKNMLQLGYGGKGSVFNNKDGPLADYVAFVRIFDLFDHEIYVVPVAEAERAAMETYQDWLSSPKGDGSDRDTKCPAVIRFEPNRNRLHVSNYKERWAQYRDAWGLLDLSAAC